MKKLFLSCIFLIGLFALSCTAPPDRMQRTDQPTEYAQVISGDQVMQADFIFVANPVTVHSPDTPALSCWMTEISNAVTLSANCKPGSKTIYISDKSSMDGTFSNRDKLTQMGFTPFKI